MRRWLAGLIGEVSQWLQNKLWPPYSERETYGTELTEDEVWEYMTRGASAYIRAQEEQRKRTRGWTD